MRTQHGCPRPQAGHAQGTRRQSHSPNPTTKFFMSDTLTGKRFDSRTEKIFKIAYEIPPRNAPPPYTRPAAGRAQHTAAFPFTVTEKWRCRARTSPTQDITCDLHQRALTEKRCSTHQRAQTWSIATAHGPGKRSAHVRHSKRERHASQKQRKTRSEHSPATQKNPPRNPVAKTITIMAGRMDHDTGRESRKGTRRNLMTEPARTREAASGTRSRDACRCIILQESCIKIHHGTTVKRHWYEHPAPDSDPVPGADAGRETMPKTPAGRLRTSVTNPI